MSGSKKTDTPSTPFTFVPYQPEDGEEYMSEGQQEHFRRKANGYDEEDIPF